MSSLTVRRPVFDLQGMHAVWAPHREWVHQINSANIIPTAIEPFLINLFLVELHLPGLLRGLRTGMRA